MLEFRQKKKFKKVLHSPIILLFLSIVLVIFIKASFNAYKKANLSTKKLDKEKLEYDKLVLREKNLASVIEFLRTEQGIESEIRNKFRVVREGENVAVIIEDIVNKEILNSSTTKKDEKNNFFDWFR